MKVWRNAVGTLALTLLVVLGLAPSTHAAQRYESPFTEHGVLSGSLGSGYLTRLAVAFYSRGSVQDSSVYIVHNQQTFAVGRLDIYSNVQDTVKTLTVLDRNENNVNLDDVELWVDTNGNGQWDPTGDTKVASTPSNLPFVGVGGDSIAFFSSFSQVLVVPANSHWKTAGGVPAASAPGDSLSQADAHLTVFVVYKTAAQVKSCDALRAAIQNGAAGVVLNATFRDTTSINGVFNQGAGSWLSYTLENDSLSGITNILGNNQFAGASYTVGEMLMLPWKQLSFASPVLQALGQPAINKGTPADANVLILRFGLQADATCGTTTFGGPVTASFPSFGRTDTTRALPFGAPKGAEFDTLSYVTVTSENQQDADVKTVKLWLKKASNTGDSLEVGDTLVATVGGTPGVSAFTSGKATLVLGSGTGVGTVVTGVAPLTYGTASGLPLANGNTRFVPSQQRKFLLTYDLNPAGMSHNNEKLDLAISQFDIFSTRGGFTPPNNVAVDSAIVTFQALPFTVWIDTLATDRALNPNAVPDSATNMHTLMVKGVIDLGDSTAAAGTQLANELAQVKVKGGTTDIDSLVVDLRAFGHSQRFKLMTNGWRPLTGVGADTIWADTFAVLDPMHGAFNDAFDTGNLSRDRYAADTYNRPTITAANGNTGFLAAPDGPYTVANVGSIAGKAFPKWFAYSRDINNNVVVDSGWAPTGFPGDNYLGQFTLVPVDTWVPARVTGVHFAEHDSGKVNVLFNPATAEKAAGLDGLQPTAKNPAGGTFLIYAQGNWTTGAPTGAINWAEPVDTIPYGEFSAGGFSTTGHALRDLFGTAGNPVSHVIKLNNNTDYLFGVRTRDNGGNLELNMFQYSTVADTLAPVVTLVSPTRQCGIFGPDSSFLANTPVPGQNQVENHHLFIYAVVDSANGPDIVNSSVKLHLRLKDIDPSTPGDQPGVWDDPSLLINAGLQAPFTMFHIGSSFWYSFEINAIHNSNGATSLQDVYEATVTATDAVGNTESIDNAFARSDSLLQGGLNHLCFVWDMVPPVCELPLINGQETSSGHLPTVDLGADSVSFTVRVTDGVNDLYHLPYFFWVTNTGRVSDYLTYGWFPVDSTTHEITFKYPASAVVATNIVPGGVTGSFTATVHDSAGNLCSSSAAFFIHDVTPPNAHFVTPLNNTRLHLPYVIQVAASDNGGLGAAVLTLFNHATGAFMDTIAIVPRPGQSQPSTSYTYSYNWNKDVLYALAVGMANDGLYDIHATVYDNSGNTVTATTTFQFDALAPTLGLAVVSPVAVNGQTVVPNGTSVTFKATPTGPFATDVVKASFYFKPVSAGDVFSNYTLMGTVTTLSNGAYWLSYGNFPPNDSIDVRVIGYDAVGNVAYDSDEDGFFDPGTLTQAFNSTPPSAVKLFTVGTQQFALATVTDVTTGLVYHPSSRLGGAGVCVLAGANDSLFIEPQNNTVQGGAASMVEYVLSGPGLNFPDQGNGSIEIGHSNTAPFNFGFSLANVTALQQYLRVFGFWTGTLTMRVFDQNGAVSDSDVVCLQVTEARAGSACITTPRSGCTVFGDVTVTAVILDAHKVAKVRFEYMSTAGGPWVPFDSMNAQPCEQPDKPVRTQAKMQAVLSQVQGCTQTFTGVWHTAGLVPDGEFFLRAVAIDSSGLVDQTPLTVRVVLDNRGPSITLGPLPTCIGGGIDFINWATFNSLVNVLHLTAGVTGASPTAQVCFQVRLATSDPLNPNSWLTLGCDNTAPFAFDFVFTPDNIALFRNLFGSTCGLRFRAVLTDTACGLTRSVVSADTTTFFADFSPPTCQFLSIGGQAVSGQLPSTVAGGSNVALVAEAFDNVPNASSNCGLDSVAFNVIGNNGFHIFDVAFPASAGVNGQFTTLWNTTGLAPGDYLVIFRAWDFAHNFCFSTATVTIADTSAPVAEIAAVNCRTVCAVSFNTDVNDMVIQIRPAGTTTWTNLGITSRVFRGTVGPQQAKLIGRKLARRLANGNVPVTLWCANYDGSQLPAGNYEFRAVAQDTVANVNPALAPIATFTLGTTNGLCSAVPSPVDTALTISFAANESACDSAIIEVGTNGQVGTPTVVVLERAINTPDSSFRATVVSLSANTVNPTRFFGSVSLNTILGGGNATVFVSVTSNGVTQMNTSGLTLFSVTPSLGSNSTISSIDGFLTVFIPPNAVSSPVSVQLLPTDVPQPQPDANRVRAVPTPNNTIECITVCSEEGNNFTFLKPIQINLKYGTPSGPNTVQALRVARWNFSTGMWDLSPVVQMTIDPTNNIAHAFVTMAGCYSVVEIDTTCAPGNLTITNVRAIPGQAAAGAAGQVPVNNFVNSRPCFSALINDQFGNSQNVTNVEVWVKPVGGNYIKFYDFKTGFHHCGIDGEGGYEPGSGFLGLCYEDFEGEGCHDGPTGSDDGEFPALKQGNYILKVTATSGLGFCSTAFDTFNVDATGPTVTNLTPTYQGNNPVIRYSVSDAGAGVSMKWQAVDLFVQEFDRDGVTIKAPIFKGTFYLGQGIQLTSTTTDNAGVATYTFSVPTHFDLKVSDHLRAVVYGGRPGDFVPDSITGPARQYLATGGVRDSLDNAAGPLEINTTIGTAPGPVVIRVPGAGSPNGACIGLGGELRFVLSDTSGMGIDRNSVTLTYVNAATGQVLATHSVANVTFSGDTLIDHPNLNVPNGTQISVTVSVKTATEPVQTTVLTLNFTVDTAKPTVVITTSGSNVLVTATDQGCSGIDSSSVRVTSCTSDSTFSITRTGTVFTVTGGVGQCLRLHVCDLAGNCFDTTFTGQTELLALGGVFGTPHNFPNPFDNKPTSLSPTTHIVIANTRAASVELRILDLAGNLIKTLTDVNAGPGKVFDWDGRDDEGRIVGRGVYLGRIKATDGSRTASTIIKIAVAR